MSKQSVALRLADALEISSNHGMRREAAAELRRLSAENQRLYAQHASVVSDYEGAVVALKAQRDELLEALRKHVELHDGDCICEDCNAIAKAEGHA